MKYITLKINNPFKGIPINKETTMRISYNKLWKMLIDKNMNKRDLAERSGVSSASIAKLSKGANITTDVLLKICESLDCTLEDIMETVKD
jgi:putative transcriptional regulator